MTIEQWNREYPVGTKVRIGDGREGLTYTIAMLLDDAPIVYVRGNRGYGKNFGPIELARVKPLREATA